MKRPAFKRYFIPCECLTRVMGSSPETSAKNACLECGTMNKEGQRTCASCGRLLNDAEDKPPHPPERKGLDVSIGFVGDDGADFEATHFSALYESKPEEAFIALMRYGMEEMPSLSQILSRAQEAGTQQTTEDMKTLVEEALLIEMPTLRQEEEPGSRGLVLLLIVPPTLHVWTIGLTEVFLHNGDEVLAPETPQQLNTCHAELRDSGDVLMGGPCLPESLSREEIVEILASASIPQEACERLKDSADIEKPGLSTAVVRYRWSAGS